MAEKPSILYDSVGPFPQGINSGIAVEALSKQQCAFANNATFRGDFATNRPGLRKLNLSEDIDTLLQQAFQAGLFQCASSYKPDASNETIIVATGGRLFSITPAATPDIESEGSEITISGDPNPANVSPNWLWQSERWLIWQNGINDAVIYDGVSSRRAQSTVSVVGQTAADFVSPPVGGVVDITLTAPYTGLLNSVLNLDEIDANGNVIAIAKYIVTKVNSIGAVYNVVLKNLGDVAGTSHAIGDQLVIKPADLGNVITVVSYNAASSFGGFNKAHATIVISLAAPTSVLVGDKVQIGSGLWTISNISSDRKTLKLNGQNNDFPPSPIVGNDIVLQNVNQPNVSVGVLNNTFVAPAIGSNATAQLQQQYTNGNGQILFIGTGQYQVVSSSVVQPPANVTVTIENLNDAEAVTVKTGSKFYNLPELPPGRMGTYGLGRNWQSGIDGISYIGGDIVGGSSGSPAFNGRDAVLKVTENTYLAGGGAFRVPGAGEIITGMIFTATLDTSLGQGPLQIFTNKNVFSCNAPVDRSVWQNVTNPIQTEALKGSGASSHWAITNSNADILFRCPDRSLRSLILSRLDFNRWGNTPISREVQRITVSENSDLMNFCSAIEFDNRWLVTSNPVQNANGVYFQSLIALNFDSISTLQEKSQSIYDGMWTGLNIFKLVRFNSVDRAFAIAANSVTGKIEIWEILKTGDQNFDSDSNPIQWSYEMPPFFLGATGKYPSNILQLENGEITAHDLIGTVNFKIQYKADHDSCWRDWHQWFVCSKQSGSDPRPQYRKPMSFGKPATAGCNVNTEMLPYLGDFFQVRVLIQGHCTVTKVRLAASLQPRPDFYAPQCNSQT